jgi:hypothetical protein
VDPDLWDPWPLLGELAVKAEADGGGRGARASGGDEGRQDTQRPTCGLRSRGCARVVTTADLLACGLVCAVNGREGRGGVWVLAYREREKRGGGIEVSFLSLGGDRPL